jgi:hypothetical protein
MPSRLPLRILNGEGNMQSSTDFNCPNGVARLTDPASESTNAIGDLGGPVARRGRKISPTTILLGCVFAAGVVTYGADRLLRTMDEVEFHEDMQRAAERGPPPPEVVDPLMNLELEQMAAHARQVADRKTWENSKLATGTVAPAITLPDCRDGHEVRLADFEGHKPVVLIFGSFSCDVLCNQLGQLQRFYTEYKDRAEFVFIHVGDAYHEMPKLEPVLGNLRPSAVNRAERTRRAMAFLGLTFPGLIDRPDGRIESAYEAWPKRLVIVDSEGRVALDAGRGLPGGWELDEVEAWLKEHTS